MFRSASAKAGLFAVALAGGCGGQAAGPASAGAPFDPLVFFAGRTAGEGELKILFKAAQPIRVQGQGRVEPDGTLVLDQQVRRGDRPVERRQWRMRQLAPGRYRGTLTDASGPVEIESKGSLLAIRYAMKGGMEVRQTLSLDRAGRTAANRMTISKFGVAVAHLNETIRKVD
ncbi:DUF3833 family protein [Sphingomonas sp. ID1715]|uniref:DUF3833 family protein n=1 Tax=Sphingomonas sp. ID1715 TaxID=1656898 RepID=UPI001488AA93|nr:DUF3833 family protein [Sphingomonas sp. ID1715]NNM75719.1 DUF3833 family protein [Sphingomonas sp. ID1715]